MKIFFNAITLLLLMDPLGNIPLFLAALKKVEEDTERHGLALSDGAREQGAVRVVTNCGKWDRERPRELCEMFHKVSRDTGSGCRVPGAGC